MNFKNLVCNDTSNPQHDSHVHSQVHENHESPDMESKDPPSFNAHFQTSGKDGLIIVTSVYHCMAQFIGRSLIMEKKYDGFVTVLWPLKNRTPEKWNWRLVSDEFAELFSY